MLSPRCIELPLDEVLRTLQGEDPAEPACSHALPSWLDELTEPCSDLPSWLHEARRFENDGNDGAVGTGVTNDGAVRAGVTNTGAVGDEVGGAGTNAGTVGTMVCTGEVRDAALTQSTAIVAAATHASAESMRLDPNLGQGLSPSVHATANWLMHAPTTHISQSDGRTPAHATAYVPTLNGCAPTAAANAMCAPVPPCPAVPACPPVALTQPLHDLARPSGANLAGGSPGDEVGGSPRGATHKADTPWAQHAAAQDRMMYAAAEGIRAHTQRGGAACGAPWRSDGDGDMAMRESVAEIADGSSKSQESQANIAVPRALTVLRGSGTGSSDASVTRRPDSKSNSKSKPPIHAGAQARARALDPRASRS